MELNRQMVEKIGIVELFSFTTSSWLLLAPVSCYAALRNNSTTTRAAPARHKQVRPRPCRTTTVRKGLDLYMTIRATILAQINRIAEQQKKALAPLTDDLALLQSGLDSLCFAILVASLDDTLDLDPFASEARLPVTLGDFIKLYEDAAAA
jgi:hypothetical protein